MIRVPEAFAWETTRREGRHGRAWLDRLPRLVTHLLQRWDLRVTGPVAHGAVALVVPVPTASQDAVLKVSFPHPGNVGEPAALAAFAGHGAVRLLAHDDEQFAPLLERADTSALSDVVDTDEAVTVAGDLSRQLAVPAPAALPTLAGAAPAWREELLEQHDLARRSDLGPLPEHVLAAALDTIAAVGADQTDTLIHGDLHFGNVLRSRRVPPAIGPEWLAIDPKGFAGTAAYEAGTVVRERLPELLARPDLRAAARQRLQRFSRAAGVDTDAAVSCAQARSVSSYYWEAQHQQVDEAVQHLRQLCEALTL